MRLKSRHVIISAILHRAPMFKRGPFSFVARSLFFFSRVFFCHLVCFFFQPGEGLFSAGSAGPPSVGPPSAEPPKIPLLFSFSHPIISGLVSVVPRPLEADSSMVKCDAMSICDGLTIYYFCTCKCCCDSDFSTAFATWSIKVVGMPVSQSWLTLNSHA